MNRWPRRSKKTKKDLKRHFDRRLKERYGLDVSIETVSRLIREGKSRPHPTWRSSNNRTHHIVVLEGTEVYVVYDKQRKAVVTALPLSSLTI